jgi:LEA14-like dessication related protein
MRALVLLAALAAAGCSKPEPPTIVPESAKVTSVDPQALHLTVTLTATNPNKVDLPVQDFTAHVVLGDKVDLGTTTVAQATSLPAGKATKVDVPLAVQWTDLTALAQLAVSPAPVPFAVDGHADLGGDLLHVAVPFTIKGSMTREQLLGAAARSLPPNLFR